MDITTKQFEILKKVKELKALLTPELVSDVVNIDLHDMEETCEYWQEELENIKFEALPEEEI